jgi:hypothetical protein
MKREFQIGLAVLAVFTVVILFYMFRRKENLETQAPPPPPPPAEVNEALESLKAKLKACGSDQSCIRDVAFKLALNRAPV